MFTILTILIGGFIRGIQFAGVCISLPGDIGFIGLGAIIGVMETGVILATGMICDYLFDMDLYHAVPVIYVFINIFFGWSLYDAIRSIYCMITWLRELFD